MFVVATALMLGQYTIPEPPLRQDRRADQVIPAPPARREVAALPASQNFSLEPAKPPQRIADRPQERRAAVNEHRSDPDLPPVVTVPQAACATGSCATAPMMMMAPTAMPTFQPARGGIFRGGGLHLFRGGRRGGSCRGGGCG